MSYEGRGELQPNCVDEGTLALVGKSQPTGLQSAACHLPETKAPGVVRVGCFGDSFTYSFEVEDGLDYPALLQRLLRERGVEQVEVLNFGNDWFGFHQARVLFERLGPRWGLDLAIFGPQSAYGDRDTTFCHSAAEAPAYVHARYVLDGEGVRLVEVPGGIDTRARFSHYNSFVPSWRTLRYDRRPPAFLRAVLPEALHERIANPFYYLSRREQSREVVTLYARLLDSMPDSARVIVGLYDSGFAESLETWPLRDGISLHGVQERGQFPYRSAGYHNSPTGNLMLAAQYANLLELDEPVAPTVIEVLDLGSPTAGQAELPLHAYERAVVSLDDQPVGGFVSMVPSFMAGELDHEQELAWQRGVIDADLLRSLRAVSLLALQPQGSVITDAAFLTLGQPLREGQRLALRCAEPQGTLIDLGVIGRVGPHLGVVQLPGGYQAFHARREAWSWSGDVIDGCTQAQGSEIVLGEEVLLRFETSPSSGRAPSSTSGLEAVPVERSLLLLRARGDILLEQAHGRSGPVELVLEGGAEARRYAIGTWVSRPFDPVRDAARPPAGAQHGTRRR